MSSPAPRECAYGDTSHPVLTVALVGDSMAGYQDSHHLTSAYALTTAPYLERRLLQVSKTIAEA